MTRKFSETKQHEQFLQITAERMSTHAVEKRFLDLKRTVETLITTSPPNTKVIDIGCGTGVQCRLWARDGYQVTGVDLDAGLIEIARAEQNDSGKSPIYYLGSAEDLPFDDEIFDVYLSLALLEHVDDWRACIAEASRVLKPDGLLVLTTSNVICPFQDEYRLPIYSWWPSPIKRWVQRIARDRWPRVANYSPCPAQHWFSIFSLKRTFESIGFVVFDRIDMMQIEGRPLPVRLFVHAARRFSAVRFFAYLMFRGTIVYAMKRPQTT